MIAPGFLHAPLALQGPRMASLRIHEYVPPAAVPRRRMGQTDDTGTGLLVPALAATLSAATAWVGFATGVREKGLLSVAGYVIGGLGGLAAIGAAFSLLGNLGGAIAGGR